MSIPTRRGRPGCLVTVLVIAVIVVGCGNKETGQVRPETAPFPTLWPSIQATSQATDQPTVHPVIQREVQPAAQSSVPSAVQPTSTPVSLGPLFDAAIGLRAGPVDVPIELHIPSLKINAPVFGVGITADNVMDAPKGPIGDPVWHTAFWYRGSSIPGEPGTAAIAAHVNDSLGRPEIFARLHDLLPGQLIIIHYTRLNIDIRFIVDAVKVYSIQESSNPIVLARIFGAEPAGDGLSHLTLITCAGNIVDGRFDHHTIVYATRID
jgi:hypothetical protein